MSEEASNIELSERRVVEELLGYPPKWFLRWGMTIITLVIAMFIGFTMLFEYPETIEAQSIITTVPEPIDIHSPITEYIETLYVSDKEVVDSAQILAVYRTETNYKSIIEVEKFIEALLATKTLKGYLNLSIPQLYDLAELNPNYVDLYNSFTTIQTTLSDGAVFREIASIESQLNLLESMEQLNNNNNSLAKDEDALLEDDLKRNESLNKDGIISDVELEQKEVQRISSKRLVNQSKINQLGTIQEAQNLNSEITSLTAQRRSLLKNQELNLRQSVLAFRLAINDWKQKYIIKAPAKGIVNLMITNVNRPFVKQDDRLFTIIPESIDEQLVAKIFIQSNNLGKVSVGNQVRVRLNAYPYEEYGTIDTEIADVSELPVVIDSENKSTYLIKCELSKHLVTNYDKKLDFKNQLDGIAFITLKSQTIFERIFQKLVALIS